MFSLDVYLKGIFAGTKLCTDGTKVSLAQVFGVDMLYKIVSPSTLITAPDTTPYWRTFFTDFLGNVSLNCRWKDLSGLISDISWRVSEGRFCLDKTWYRWDNCIPRSGVWSRCALKDCFSDHSHTRTRHNAILKSLCHWFLGKHKPHLQLKDLLSHFNCISIARVIHSWTAFLCFLKTCIESALLFGQTMEQMSHTTPGFWVCRVSICRTRLCLLVVSWPQARQRQRWQPWGSISCTIREDRASERFYQCNVYTNNVLQ